MADDAGGTEGGGSSTGDPGFSLFGHDLFGQPVQQAGGPLAQRFAMPPFSVLSARDGAWQARKRAWLSLGFDSVQGRDENYVKGDATAIHKGVQGDITAGTAEELKERFAQAGTGMSIFDPVVAELALRWWSPPGGVVLDPFAGGSVRGVVTGMLGRRYVGVDLRPEQVTENRAQFERLSVQHPSAVPPTWLVGDATDLPTHVQGALPARGADMVFTCPPYHDLEVYSDDPRDLSNMDWLQFQRLYMQVIQHSVDLLAPNRFAVWVVGDLRDSKGGLRNLVGLTVDAHLAAGATYYNDAILVTPVGTLPVRTSFQFKAGRKLGRSHQYALVFCKGDPMAAAKACGVEAAATPDLLAVNRATEREETPAPAPPTPAVKAPTQPTGATGTDGFQPSLF